MSLPRYHAVGHEWYKVCTKLAEQHRINSVEHCFWWSLRTELLSENMTRWAKEPEAAFTAWLQYLEYKLDQRWL